MTYADRKTCERLSAAGVPPDTDMVWVCVFPSYPMYQMWSLKTAEYVMRCPAVRLTPVYTLQLAGEYNVRRGDQAHSGTGQPTRQGVGAAG